MVFALTLIRELPVKRSGQLFGESDSRMWSEILARLKEAFERLSIEDVVWAGGCRRDEPAQRRSLYYGVRGPVGQEEHHRHTR